MRVLLEAGPLYRDDAFVRHTYLVIDFEGLTPNTPAVASSSARRRRGAVK